MAEDSDPGSIRVRTSTGEQIAVPVPKQPKGWAEKVPLVVLLGAIATCAAAAGGVMAELRAMTGQQARIEAKLDALSGRQDSDHDRIVRLEVVTKISSAP